MYTDFESQFFNESTDIKEVRFSKNLECQLQYVNQHFCDMIQFYSNRDVTPADLIGKNIGEVLPKKTIDVLTKLSNNVLKKKTQLSYFTTFHFKKHTVSIVVSERPYFIDNQLAGTLTTAHYLNLFVVEGKPVMLSSRELDVLVHITFGLTSKTTARNLSISVGTVVTYINRIRKKLKVTTQKDLVLLLKQHALGQHVLDYLCKLINNQVLLF